MHVHIWAAALTLHLVSIQGVQSVMTVCVHVPVCASIYSMPACLFEVEQSFTRSSANQSTGCVLASRKRYTAIQFHWHADVPFPLPPFTYNMWKVSVSSWSNLLNTDIILGVDPLHIQASKSTTHKVLVTASSCFPMWSPQWGKDERKESWPLLSYTSKNASTPPLAFVWPSDLALVFWKVGPYFLYFVFTPVLLRFHLSCSKSPTLLILPFLYFQVTKH